VTAGAERGNQSKTDGDNREYARPVRLLPYADADLPLTEALESDPDVMRQLGGPIPRAEILANHRRRLGDPWWLTIVLEPGGPPVGTIGIWESEHDGETIHETGWLVLPAFQGRGIASAALAALIGRARREPRFERIHAFPGVANVPSNALCRRLGFSALGEVDITYADRRLRCHHWALETPDASSTTRSSAS
jgi:RimJ/RimL family protein N-acetyltransferase